ncbi:glycine zipper 2TM domain-containing protein [Sphingomonas sp. CJ20]
MKHLISLAALAAASFAVSSPAAAQSGVRYAAPQEEEARLDAAQRRFDNEYQIYHQAVERYRRSRAVNTGWNGPRPGPDPRYDDGDDWDAPRYYRPGNYQERVLSRDDRVYRGEDGRYYCRRPDGTAGLVVGAAAGGLFGNVIAGRGSRTVGTLLGAIAGGALGNSIDRNNQANNQEVRCR